MELLHECPACQQLNIKFQHRVKDHFLSKQDFQIFQCYSCGLLFTNPRPEKNEIGQYYKSDDYVSHSDTSKGLINSAYQIVKKQTLRWKAQQVESLVSKGSLLDIGCGTGSFLAQMKDRGWQVKGIEPDPDARDLAIRNHGLDVGEEDDISRLADESFDAITMWHVLEHVYNPNQRLEEVRRLLKPDGLAVLALPNPSSPDAIRYNDCWAAWDVPRHVLHFKPRVVHNMMRAHGFRFIASKGMRFDAYYISMLSEKYKGSLLHPVKGAIHGFLSNLSASRRTEAYSSMMYLFRR